MENRVEAPYVEKHDVSIYQSLTERREKKKIKGQIKKNEKQMALRE